MNFFLPLNNIQTKNQYLTKLYKEKHSLIPMTIDKKPHREVLGKQIVTKEGKKLGSVKDITFETRTGELIHLVLKDASPYSNQLNLKPDILVFGKKSQISGIMVNDKFSEAIKSPYRKLEVTFDGDLIDACRCEYIIKAIEKYSLLKKVRENSEILKDELSQLFLNYRSIGHLIAFDFMSMDKRDNFVSKAYENKVLV